MVRKKNGLKLLIGIFCFIAICIWICTEVVRKNKVGFRIGDLQKNIVLTYY